MDKNRSRNSHAWHYALEHFDTDEAQTEAEKAFKAGWDARDKAVFKAETPTGVVEGPYTVEPVEGRGCEVCGQGHLYDVVYKPQGVALGQSYGEKEDAEYIANALNDAFALGFANSRAEKTRG